MAISASRTESLIIGNAYMHIYSLTFTSVTGGVINTGMARVMTAMYQPTKSDDHGIVYMNYSDAGTTQANGQVYVDAVSSGDTGHLVIIGTC